MEPLGSMKTWEERLAARFPQWFAAAPAEEEACRIRIATEFDVLPVQQYKRLEAALPGADWEDGSLLVREQRMIKSPDEVAAIRGLRASSTAALEAAIPHIREGMAEFELMAFIEHQLRMQGHLGLMRMRASNSELVTGMVAAGAAAAVPTYFDGPAGGLGFIRPARKAQAAR